MRACVRVFLCAGIFVTVGFLSSCEKDKAERRKFSPTQDLASDCRQPDDAMYSRTPVYTNAADQAVLVGYVHYYDVDQSPTDESDERGGKNRGPICLLEPGAKGAGFRGDTIIWQSQKYKFTINFVANTTGCSKDSPFKDMPSATATDTQVGSYPTGNGAGAPIDTNCEYKATFTDGNGTKIADPHLRIGK